MRCAELVIWACLALCSESIHAQQTKTNVSKPVDIVTRQKRSLWTSLVEHIDSFVETFHTKPLLVDGTNDVGKFGLTIKNKGKRTRSNFAKMVNSKDKKETNPFDENEEEEDSKEKQEREDAIPCTLAEYRDDLVDIEKDHKEVLQVEKELIEYLLAEIPEWQTDLKTVIVEKGIKNSESEKLISKIISRKPNIQDQVKFDIKTLRASHERIRKQIKDFLKDLSDQDYLPAKDTNKMINDIGKVNKINNEWLAHKTILEFKVRKKGKLVRVKVKI